MLLFCSVEGIKSLLETLRLKFSAFFHEVQMSRSHVTRALKSGLWFEVHVCTAWPLGKLNLPHGNLKFEMKYDFYNSSAYWLSNFILKKCNFEDNFSAKIEQSGFMNENKHGSHEQPPANFKSQIWADG